MKRTTLVAVGLVLLTAAIFCRVGSLEFLSYDDPDYITLNPIIQKGLSGEGLAWAFGKIHGQETYWHPITWVSHMLDVEMFGLRPGGHHLVSLAFHIANVVLLFVMLNAATGALWRSALVAALFAIHPLQVESVAWITERKNVLSTFFWMLTLWFYVGYTRAPGTGRYLASLGSYAIGLMCKPALVPLPAVLLLLDYWPLRRLTFGSKTATPSPPVGVRRQPSLKKLLLEKLPFFALAIILSLITLSAHRGLGMINEAGAPPRSLEIGNIFVSYVRYLRKALWPSDLAVFYPFPTSLAADLVIGAVVILLAITALVLWQGKRKPYLAVGWFWFLGVLIPAIGIVRVGVQAMADRFVYVPIVGLFIAVVWWVADLLESRNVSTKVPLPSARWPLPFSSPRRFFKSVIGKMTRPCSNTRAP